MKYNKELFINNIKYLISFKDEPEITLRLKNYEEAFVVAYEDFVDLRVGNKDTIKLNDIEEVFDYINFDDIISIEGDIDYNYPVTSQSIVVDGNLWLDGERPSEVIAKYNKESNAIRTIFSLISITLIIYVIAAALSNDSSNDIIIIFSILAGVFLLAVILFSYLDKKRNNIILKYYGEVKSIDKTKAQKLLDDIEIIDNCNYDLYDVFRIDEIDDVQIESILKNILKGNKIHINNYNFLKDIEEEIRNNPSKYKDEKVNTYISEVIKLLENNICEI